MSKSILVTGATGKQGGSVIDSLLGLPSASSFTILAVTRSPTSPSAGKLASKSPAIKLVEGDLNDVPALFASAGRVHKAPIWGVYSVQISQGKDVTFDGEIAQGKALIDESLKQGVKHFVYSSVERGGDAKSWENETPVPHFQTKLRIEQHLREAAGGKMGWTILRPVAFMDNLQPGFQSKVFMTALDNTLKGKKLQWVATSDIGAFAAMAFDKPDEWNHEAIGLAGDDLDVDEVNKAFKNTTGSPLGTTFGFLGSTLMYMVGELGTMIRWFKTDGYGADIEKLRKLYPGTLTMEQWIREKSSFTAK